MEDLRRSAILRSSSTGNCSTARSRPASKVRGECAGADAIASRGGAGARDQPPRRSLAAVARDRFSLSSDARYVGRTSAGVHRTHIGLRLTSNSRTQTGQGGRSVCRTQAPCTSAESGVSGRR
jgi:hypothetical protein